MTERPALGLTLGVAAVSCAALLIRFCHVPALAIGFYRLALAGAAFTAWARFRHPGFWRLPRHELLAIAAAGTCLALHFATWILSLSYTSVACSVVLVTTNPIFVALGSRLFLGEAILPAVAGGIALATLGGGIIAFSSGHDASASHALLGNGLALLGAVFASAYFLLGRRMRGAMPTTAYVALVYGVAALVSAFLCLLFRIPLHHYAPRDWMLLVLLAVIPQGIGHTMLNWSLRFVSPAVVALSVLGEPVGATLLAWAFLHEIPGPWAIVGCLLILLGVALAGVPEAAEKTAVHARADG
ncbi:MAG: DMT family transporter [Candidatus Xenobia bacterium]